MWIRSKIILAAVMLAIFLHNSALSAFAEDRWKDPQNYSPPSAYDDEGIKTSSVFGKPRIFH